MPTIRWVHVPKIQSFPNIEKGLKSHDKNVLNVFPSVYKCPNKLKVMTLGLGLWPRLGH
jgi:hypothetical protein